MRVRAVGLSALGIQAAAQVEAVGPEAAGFAPGDRVAYRMTETARGQNPTISERDLIGFPKDVSFDQAAALLPCGLIARTIVKQLHSIGRGNRVSVAPDRSGAHAFVRAWAVDLGAQLVEPGSPDVDIAVNADDYAAARLFKYSHGFGQQASSEVFQAVRRGVFAGLEIPTYPLADASRARSDIESSRAAGPVLLLPAAA